MVGLDSSDEAVGEACRRGVDARTVRWPDETFEASGFDRVLFVRSLHHVERLRAGVAAARDALGPGGLLLAEDFDRVRLDPRAGAWFRGAVRLLDAAAALEPEPDDFAGRLLAGQEPGSAWRGHHDQELATLREMRRVLAQEMAPGRDEPCPALFHYLAGALPDTGVGGALLARLREAERDLLATGAIEPPGRMLVAARS